MKTLNISNRGQVLILFVFAVIGLIGVTGLAIDGSNIYSDRRHAQNAADTAALAAAVVKVKGEKNSEPGCGDLSGASLCGYHVLTAAQEMARTNGYSGNLVDSTVQVFTPPFDGTYSHCGSSYTWHCEDYIQVIISTNVNTWFAKVLGIRQLHNRVEAVALAKYDPSTSLYGGSSLVEMAPTGTGCSGEVTLTGSANITLNGGGIFVNSDNSTCALKETAGCVTFNLLNGASIQGVGGQYTPSCPTAPTMQHASTGYQFPPDRLFQPPAACNQTPAAWHLDGDGFSHYFPGHYTMLPPDKNTRLDPGVYCVDNVIKTTNPTTLLGDGVFIYIKPGGSFNFQGGTVHLTAPASADPYGGYLIYVDSNYTQDPATWGDANCNINGNASTSFTGVIYAPNCNVTLNGTSAPSGLYAQIIAYTLKLNGSLLFNFDYTQTPHPLTPEINWTGLYH